MNVHVALGAEKRPEEPPQVGAQTIRVGMSSFINLNTFATGLVGSIQAREPVQILDWWQQNSGEELIGGDELKEAQEGFYAAFESLRQAYPEAYSILLQLESAHQGCVTIAADACLMSGVELGRKIIAR